MLNALRLVNVDVLASDCAVGQQESCRCVKRTSFPSSNLLAFVDKVVLVNQFW